MNSITKSRSALTDSHPIKRTLLDLFKSLVSAFGGTGVSQSIPFVGAIYRYVFSRLAPDLVEIDGHQCYISRTDLGTSLELVLRGSHEPFQRQIFRGIIKQGMTVVDIGANIGLYTVLASELVGSQGRVYAFEPHPETFVVLKKNLTLHHAINVHPVQKAVSNETGTSQLFVSPNNSASHHLFSYHNPRESTMPVDVVSLDEFFETKPCDIDVIKMDIEGGESVALQGMRTVFRRTEKVAMFTEFNQSLLKRAGRSGVDYLHQLNDLGFTLFHIDEAHTLLTKIHTSQFESFASNYTTTTNLLCLRGIDAPSPGANENCH